MPYYKRFLYVVECIHPRNVIPELFFRHIWRHFRAPCQPVFFADSFNMLNKIKKRTFFLKLFFVDFIDRRENRGQLRYLAGSPHRLGTNLAQQMSSEAVKLSAVRLLPLTSAVPSGIYRTKKRMTVYPSSRILDSSPALPEPVPD